MNINLITAVNDNPSNCDTICWAAEFITETVRTAEQKFILLLAVLYFNFLFQDVCLLTPVELVDGQWDESVVEK